MTPNQADKLIDLICKYANVRESMANGVADPESYDYWLSKRNNSFLAIKSFVESLTMEPSNGNQ